METVTLRPKPDRRRQPRIPPTDVADGIHQRIRAEYLEMPGQAERHVCAGD